MVVAMMVSVEWYSPLTLMIGLLQSGRQNGFTCNHHIDDAGSGEMGMVSLG